MEDLNKNQIVLLTLLVSFVTSIATGIMTVSLLQEAPIEVTRNINRIVEKTIETVTPGTVSTPQKEVTTVVVKEEDLIVDSINKNIKSIVRIKEKDAYLGTTSFYGIGLVTKADGTIVADRKTINTSNTYTGIMNDGSEFVLTPKVPTKETIFVSFKAKAPEKYVFTPVTFGVAEPKLGQTVIALGGETSNSILVGRALSLDVKDSTLGTTTTKTLVGIGTDLSSKDLILGSLLFNLSGDMIGLKMIGDYSGSFSPVSVLKKEISILAEPEKTQ